MPFTLVRNFIFNQPFRKRIAFILLFNKKPQFFTKDEQGRRENSFQIYYDCDAELVGPSLDQDLADRIIRGDEMTLQGVLPIRNRSGSDPNPNSGGWGPIVGSVHYLLVGRYMSFAVPWNILGEDNGIFSYAIQLTEFGGITDLVFGPAFFRPPSIATS